MRPNLVLMLAFLIFLVGFFSSQISLTGHIARDSFRYSSLTNEELVRFGHLTVEYCRELARDVSYAQRSSGLNRVPFEEGQGSPLTKTQYQLQERGEDLNGDGRLDRRDSDFCYDVVNRRAPYATSPTLVRSATLLSTCTTPGERRCSYGDVAVCAADAMGTSQWVIEERAGKAQQCRDGVIESLTVFKPWLQRLSP